jgi:hypothetical protein
MEITLGPQHELDRTIAALDQIVKHKKMDFEIYWEDYLTHLYQVWSKAHNHYKQYPKWLAWVDPFYKIKKSDPLLEYLAMARGHHVHTGGRVVQTNMPSIVNRRSPNGANALDGKTSQPFRMMFYGVVTTLPPVTFEKKTYQPPTCHLGQPIDPDDIATIGTLGVRWHEEFLHALQEEFIKGKDKPVT